VAVAFDAATDGGGFTSSSSRSFSHTISANSNGALYIPVCYWNSGGTVTSCTYGSTSLSLVHRSALSPAQDRIEWWRLLAAPVGTATVAVNFSAAADGEASAVSFTGVDQTTPERLTPVSSTWGPSTTGSISITSTGAQTGDAILDAIAWDFRGTAFFMGAQTNRVQRFNTSVVSGEGGAGSTVIPGVDPQTLDWTWSIGTSRNGVLGYVVIAAAGAGGAAQDTPELRGRPYGLRGQSHMTQILVQ
jgi:hypothetical protein